MFVCYFVASYRFILSIFITDTGEFGVPTYNQRQLLALSQTNFYHRMLWVSWPGMMETRPFVGGKDAGLGCGVVIWPCYRYRAKE